MPKQSPPACRQAKGEAATTVELDPAVRGWPRKTPSSINWTRAITIFSTGSATSGASAMTLKTKDKKRRRLGWRPMAKPTKTARKPKPKPVMHPISPMLANLMAADDLTETLIDTCTAVKARLDEHAGFGLPRPGQPNTGP